MRPVQNNLSITLPPVHLYLDDLEHIIQRLSDGMEVLIEHRGFVYNSLEEVKDHIKRDTISELHISAGRREPTYGSLAVNVTTDEVTVRADHTVAERATLITEFLRSRVLWYSWRPVGHWWYGVHGAIGMFLSMTVPGVISGFAPIPKAPRIILSAIAFLLLMSWTLSNRVWIGGSRIYLYPSVSHMGFWERNREKILVSAIISIMTGLIGFFLGRLTH